MLNDNSYDKPLWAIFSTDDISLDGFWMGAKFSSYVHNILTSLYIAAYSQNPGIFTANTSFMMGYA